MGTRCDAKLGAELWTVEGFALPELPLQRMWLALVSTKPWELPGGPLTQSRRYGPLLQGAMTLPEWIVRNGRICKDLLTPAF